MQMIVKIMVILRFGTRLPIRITIMYPTVMGADIPPAVIVPIVIMSHNNAVNSIPAIQTLLYLTRVITPRDAGITTRAIRIDRPINTGTVNGAMSMNRRLRDIRLMAE
jgi:hypothetical protein